MVRAFGCMQDTENTHKIACRWRDVVDSIQVGGKLLFRAEVANLACQPYAYQHQHQHHSAGITASSFSIFKLHTSHPNPQPCPFQRYSLPVMATLAPPSPSQSPTRMPRKWARKCERYCCLGATYFPLVFVYSITSWAVWVEATIGFLPAKTLWIGILSLSL